MKAGSSKSRSRSGQNYNVSAQKTLPPHHLGGVHDRDARYSPCGGPQHSRCEIRIGTSGWHYKHWLGRCYPAGLAHKDMFAQYSREFDTVEINNSFYRLPSAATFDAWKSSAPAGFCFAVKASRFLTHLKKLSDPKPALDLFLPLAERLGDKLGPILFQLPPRWRCNLERLTRFLDVLPTGHRYSIEFRDPSWHHEGVYGALRDHNVAYCIYELAGFQSPIEITADFVYVRLHGPGAKYQGDYSKRSLRTWADRIEQWGRRLKAVFLYFDNDEAAYAVKNARELKAMLT
jgi:uncharacterized protein YecE (DUF72 family)